MIRGNTCISVGKRKNVWKPQKFMIEMTKVDSLLYLGDSFNTQGTSDENVKMRELKAVGILSQIKSILKNVTLGIYNFKTAFILHEAMLINGIYTNYECWMLELFEQ